MILELCAEILIDYGGDKPQKHWAEAGDSISSVSEIDNEMVNVCILSNLM